MAFIIQSIMCSKKTLVKSYENYKKSPKDRLTRESYLETRLDALEDQWKLITNSHSKLCNELTPDLQQHEYFSRDVYTDIEDIYVSFKSDVVEALSACKSVSSSSSKAQLASTSKCETNVHLPKISIPTFTGTYSDWPSFRDLFVSLIDTNNNLDNVQKMHYLKGHLSGEAELLLRDVPITAESYLTSWATLNRRYNNKKHLANNLLKRFMNLPYISSESCSDIKELLDVTNNTLNGLKTLGVNVSSWDVIIIYIISTKMDSETRKLWEAQISTSDDLPTMQHMRDFLESRFRSLEFIDTKAKPKSNFSNQKARVMHIVQTGSNSGTDLCVLCKNGNHKLWQCKEFSKLNYDARHNFVRTNNLCFNCLGRNHSARACRTVTKCRICKHNHHSLLHPKPTSESRAPDSLQRKVTLEEKSGSSSSSSSENTASVSNIKAHFSKEVSPNQVILATALVKAASRNHIMQILRALLDQGSEASLVTEAAVKRLGLKKIPRRCIITGLGGNRGYITSKYVVKLKIISDYDPNFELEVEAHVLRSITGLLPSNKIDNLDWPQLAEVSLADPDFMTPNKIDILLGADSYGKVLEEGLMKAPNGILIAQQTAFGWAISGSTQQKSLSKSAQCYHRQTQRRTILHS